MVAGGGCWLRCCDGKNGVGVAEDSSVLRIWASCCLGPSKSAAILTRRWGPTDPTNRQRGVYPGTIPASRGDPAWMARQESPGAGTALAEQRTASTSLLPSTSLSPRPGHEFGSAAATNKVATGDVGAGAFQNAVLHTHSHNAAAVIKQATPPPQSAQTYLDLIHSSKDRRREELQAPAPTSVSFWIEIAPASRSAQPAVWVETSLPAWR